MPILLPFEATSDNDPVVTVNIAAGAARDTEGIWNAAAEQLWLTTCGWGVVIQEH